MGNLLNIVFYVRIFMLLSILTAKCNHADNNYVIYVLYIVYCVLSSGVVILSVAFFVTFYR